MYANLLRPVTTVARRGRSRNHPWLLVYALSPHRQCDDPLQIYHIAMSRNRDFETSIEVAAGRIFWLPSKNGCDESLIDDLELDQGCFNHPVLILTADFSIQMAVVLIVNQIRVIQINIFHLTNPRSLHPSTVKVLRKSFPEMSLCATSMYPSFHRHLIPITAFSFSLTMA